MGGRDASVAGTTAAAGFGLRRPTAADFAAVLAVIRAADAADGAPGLAEEELRAE